MTGTDVVFSSRDEADVLEENNIAAMSTEKAANSLTDNVHLEM